MNESKFHKNPFLQHLGEKFISYLLHYQLWNTLCYRIISHMCHNPTSCKIVVSDFIRALQTEQKTKEQQHSRAHFSSTQWAWLCLFMDLLTSRCQIQEHPKYTSLLPSAGMDKISQLQAAWLNPGTGWSQSVSELQSGCPKAYALDTGQLSSFLIIESLPERAVTHLI